MAAVESILSCRRPSGVSLIRWASVETSFLKEGVAKFHLQKHMILQFIWPLDGFTEAGDLLFEYVNCHHRSELDMEILRSNPAPCLRNCKESIVDLSGTYVNDTIRAGSKLIYQKSQIIRENLGWYMKKKFRIPLQALN